MDSAAPLYRNSLSKWEKVALLGDLPTFLAVVMYTVPVPDSSHNADNEVM